MLGIYVIHKVTPAKDKNGNIVKGVYEYQAQCLSPHKNLQPFEVFMTSPIANFAGGFKFVPEVGNKFIGARIDNVVYCLAFIPNIDSMKTRYTDEISEMYKDSNLEKGDLSYSPRGANSEFTIKKSGEMVFKAGTKALMVLADLVKESFSKFHLAVQNLIVRTIGGFFRWGSKGPDDPRPLMEFDINKDFGSRAVSMTSVMSTGNFIDGVYGQIGSVPGGGLLRIHFADGTFNYVLEIKNGFNLIVDKLNPQNVTIELKNVLSKLYLGGNGLEGETQELATKSFVENIFKNHVHLVPGVGMTGPFLLGSSTTPYPCAPIAPVVKDSKFNPYTFTTLAE